MLQVLLSTALCAAPPVERQLADHVEANASAALELVQALAEIPSGTLDPEGVRKVGAVLEARLAKLGMKTRWVEAPEGSERGPSLFARVEGGRGPKLLLIGHLDTVFEKQDGFTEVRIEDGYMHGPGVYDMKGGDVVILSALEALHAAGQLRHMNVVVALTGDEEKMARPRVKAREALVEAAKWADIALGFEPAFGEHRVSIARRGSSSWTLEVEAEGGHSSRVGPGGKRYGAVYEAARLMERMRQLVEASETLTMNPGLFVGASETSLTDGRSRVAGQGKGNRIPTSARVTGDLRFLSEEEKSSARAALKEAAQHSLPGTRSSFDFSDGYPAMPPTEASRRLFATLDAINQELGFGPLGLVPPSERGAADISFAAPHVEAGLAGLGVAGSGAHDPSERMKMAHLRVASLRAAVLMYRLSRPD